MGKKGQLLTKRGKPKGRTKLFSSRDVCECCVPQCSVIKRNDKVQEHQEEMVLFNADGSVASPSHEDYSKLNRSQRQHTDFFRSKNATVNCFPSNKVVTPLHSEVHKDPKQSRLTGWLGGGGRKDKNDNIVEDMSSDVDDPKQMSGSEDSEGCQDDGNVTLNLAQADTDGGQCVNNCSPQCPPTLMDSEREDNPFTPPPMNFAIEDLAFHPRLNLSQEGREAWSRIGVGVIRRGGGGGGGKCRSSWVSNWRGRYRQTC